MISAYVWRDFLTEQGFEISYLSPTVWATKRIGNDLSLLFEADGQAVRLSGIINCRGLNFSGFKYRSFTLGANPGAIGGAELVKVVGLFPHSLEDIKVQIEALTAAGENVLRQIQGLEDACGRC